MNFPYELWELIKDYWGITFNIWKNKILSCHYEKRRYSSSLLLGIKQRYPIKFLGPVVKYNDNIIIEKWRVPWEHKIEERRYIGTREEYNRLLAYARYIRRVGY